MTKDKKPSATITIEHALGACNLSADEWDALSPQVQNLLIDLVMEREKTRRFRVHLATIEGHMTEVRTWNTNDIRGFDDITPSLRMLAARSRRITNIMRVLRRAIKGE